MARGAALAPLARLLVRTCEPARCVQSLETQLQPSVLGARALYGGAGGGASAADAGAPPAEDAAHRRATANRLLYRARQRGWLELDLLVGEWAEANVHSLRPDALAAFEALLAEENPDLFKWLTGQAPAPPAVQGNAAFRLIRAHVGGAVAAHRPRAAAARAGAEWVRGWDDAGWDGGKGGGEVARGAPSGGSGGGGGGGGSGSGGGSGTVPRSSSVS